MSDSTLFLLSWGVLAAGLSGCALLHRLGLKTTYVRDVLHIGTGVWVLAWPLFQEQLAPVAIVLVVALATASVPVLARHSPSVAHFRDLFAGGDERWGGLTLYTGAYALFTWVGFSVEAFPAAAALLSLSLGDGVGGFVGRRYGKHHFSVPGGKRKSLEGSLTVLCAATCGVLLAAWRFGADVSLLAAFGLGLGAALAEALSPRGTDNVTVPAMVWALAEASR